MMQELITLIWTGTDTSKKFRLERLEYFVDEGFPKITPSVLLTPLFKIGSQMLGIKSI